MVFMLMEMLIVEMTKFKNIYKLLTKKIFKCGKYDIVVII